VDAALQGDPSVLAAWLEGAKLRDRPAPMVHHLAIHHETVATALETTAPEAAGRAWTVSLAAWLALGEEGAYLAHLEQAILGHPSPVTIPPERVPLDFVAELASRAEKTSRDLLPAGRAALRALGAIDEAVRIAGVESHIARRAREAAERGRTAALDAALAVVGGALDDADLRGELTNRCGTILAPALRVWTWSGRDAAVEQFVVDRLATVGWRLYRARAWDALESTFEPFRPIIEHLAARVESDPTQVAFAAACAQMFVFLTDVEPPGPRKRELAERAVRLCPAHRNGRLNLAALLCQDAISSMRSMVVFARREELERVEALLARAEGLYRETAELPEAKAMLERIRRGRISL
jgi:hypothetical protein